MTHDAVPSPAVAAAVEPDGFASVLRAATHAVHREAERSGFIADLLRGRATRHGYAVYLANLLPVYAMMETHLSPESAVPALRAFAAPGLARVASLRGDIAVLARGDEEPLTVLPEALAYAEAIEHSTRGDGTGLVAHVYARYLGDLSGGQILKPLLARTLALEPEALSFYDFPGIADIATCKVDLRDALDTIVPGSAEASGIADEAIMAFRHTIALSSAISKAMSGVDAL